MTSESATLPMKGSNEVMELLRNQSRLFERLEGFADRQRSLVAEDDPRPLLALLADRQKLAKELTQIAVQLSAIRKNWATFREGLATNEKAEADGLVDEATRRLRRVIEGDERDSRLLQVKKRITSDALRATRATSEAITAYRLPISGRNEAVRLDEAS